MYTLLAKLLQDLQQRQSVLLTSAMAGYIIASQHHSGLQDETDGGMPYEHCDVCCAYILL